MLSISPCGSVFQLLLPMIIRLRQILSLKIKHRLLLAAMVESRVSNGIPGVNDSRAPLGHPAVMVVMESKENRDARETLDPRDLLGRKE